MSKYNHTPGPWVCHSGAVWKDAPDVYPKGDNSGIPIALMDREQGNGTDPVERDCNAKLIAKAPELLAMVLQHRHAFQSLKEELITGPCSMNETDDREAEIIQLQGAVDDIDKLLAKIEGE